MVGELRPCRIHGRPGQLDGDAREARERWEAAGTGGGGERRRGEVLQGEMRRGEVLQGEMPAGCEWIRPQWVAVENKSEKKEKIKKKKN
jgi:hypothetical protein